MKEDTKVNKRITVNTKGVEIIDVVDVVPEEKKRTVTNEQEKEKRGTSQRVSWIFNSKKTKSKHMKKQCKYQYGNNKGIKSNDLN